MTCYSFYSFGTHQDLEHLAEERGSHFQKQKCCHSLDLTGEKQTDTEISKKGRENMKNDFVVQSKSNF